MIKGDHVVPPQSLILALCARSFGSFFRFIEFTPRNAGSLAIPEMLPKLKGEAKAFNRYGSLDALSAADAGTVFDPGLPGCRADHPDSASHSPICLYEARGKPGHGPCPVVRLAGRQLFQYSGHNPARSAGQVGADR